LERPTQVRIAHAIDSLADDPRPRGAVKLAGDQDFYRIRAGDYRIIYSITDEKLIVLVIAVGHRRDIYRR
jgi:mRNA interferase RelE/StbE